MAGRVFTFRQPRTEWFKRVAGRLLERSPELSPLDAVRMAMDAFPDSRHQAPDTVADSLIDGHACGAAHPDRADSGSKSERRDGRAG